MDEEGSVHFYPTPQFLFPQVKQTGGEAAVLQILNPVQSYDPQVKQVDVYASLHLFWP